MCIKILLAKELLKLNYGHLYIKSGTSIALELPRVLSGLYLHEVCHYVSPWHCSFKYSTKCSIFFFSFFQEMILRCLINRPTKHHLAIHTDQI